MAYQNTRHRGYVEKTEFGGSNMSDREWREYCRGIRLFKAAKIETPFHEAMNAQGEQTAALAIESALRERDIEND